jgi:hypothetical protein
MLLLLMNKNIRFASALFLIATGSLLAADDADIRSQIKFCSLKAEQSARLECYDSLSRNLASDAAASASVASAISAADAPVAATAAQPDNANQGIPVKSISCQRGHSDEYIFTLDNGEIWKQVGSNRVRVADCEFSAMIEKDFFGYKMIIDDKKLKFRVKRIN